MRRSLLVFVLCSLVMSSLGALPKDDMNPVAERYVHLVLALDRHHPIVSTRFTGRPSGRRMMRSAPKGL